MREYVSSAIARSSGRSKNHQGTSFRARTSNQECDGRRTGSRRDANGSSEGSQRVGLCARQREQDWRSANVQEPDGYAMDVMQVKPKPTNESPGMIYMLCTVACAALITLLWRFGLSCRAACTEVEAVCHFAFEHQLRHGTESSLRELDPTDLPEYGRGVAIGSFLYLPVPGSAFFYLIARTAKFS
jgi:hypothetical protein